MRYNPVQRASLEPNAECEGEKETLRSFSVSSLSLRKMSNSRGTFVPSHPSPLCLLISLSLLSVHMDTSAGSAAGGSESRSWKHQIRELGEVTRGKGLFVSFNNSRKLLGEEAVGSVLIVNTG